MSQTKANLKVHLECDTFGPTGGKFWLAEVFGGKVIVRWGPRGKTGQTKEYQFGNPTTALDYVLDKEREKLGKGYYEVSRQRAPLSQAKPEPPPDPPPAQNVSIISNETLSWDF